MPRWPPPAGRGLHPRPAEKQGTKGLHLETKQSLRPGRESGLPVMPQGPCWDQAGLEGRRQARGPGGLGARRVPCTHTAAPHSPGKPGAAASWALRSPRVPHGVYLAVKGQLLLEKVIRKFCLLGKLLTTALGPPNTTGWVFLNFSCTTIKMDEGLWSVSHALPGAGI